MNTPLISAKELSKILEKENTVIIDAGGSNESFARYMEKHIEGAQYVDLEKQLSEVPENAKNGGRHPLPPISEFVKLVGELGIDPSSTVVVYDDKGAVNSAARFWWMMKALGHKKLYVLNGGLNAAVSEGIALTSNPFTNKEIKPAYPIEDWQLPKVDMNEVEKLRNHPDYRIIDVRAKERFDGVFEPIDILAGHIPGAVNIPLENNLTANGTFKSPEELRSYYQEKTTGISPENIVIHCGSGVTACHTILAFDHAGLKIPKLYVGSWSEWSRNDNPIATD